MQRDLFLFTYHCKLISGLCWYMAERGVKEVHFNKA